jgi:hypothetical protein
MDVKMVKTLYPSSYPWARRGDGQVDKLEQDVSSAAQVYEYKW